MIHGKKAAFGSQKCNKRNIDKLCFIKKNLSKFTIKKINRPYA